jgi:cell division protein ZapA
VSTVTLSIGPKNYTVACADGEEAHIAALGAMIAEKYALLGTARAPLEAQNLLFAALFLADELAEARRRAESASAPTPAEAPQADPGEIAALRATIEALEAQLAEARALPAPAPTPQADLFAGGVPAGPDTDALAARLEALAERAEANAAALEAAAPNA